MRIGWISTLSSLAIAGRCPNYDCTWRTTTPSSPVKPTIDMESRYENHPDGAASPRRMDAHQAREAAYWAMLAGAAGHGYGCNSHLADATTPQRMPAADDVSFPFARLQGTTRLDARPWTSAGPLAWA